MPKEVKEVKDVWDEIAEFEQTISTQSKLLSHIKTLLQENKQTQESINQITQLVNQSASKLFLVDESAKFIFANSKLAEDFGTTIDGVIGKTVFDFFSRPNAELLQRETTEIISTKKSIHREHIFQFGNLTRHELVHQFPVSLVESNVTYMGGIVTDITEIRDTQKEKERTEAELVAAQAIAKIGSWKYLIQSRKLSCSKEHYRIYELSESIPEDLLFESLVGRIHPNDRENFVSAFERAIDQGTDFAVDYRICFENCARTKHIRAIGRVSKIASGMPDQISGTSQDITESVELFSQLQSERTKALHNAKLASLGEMSAGIAHEINNPLAIIAGCVLLLSKIKDNPEKIQSKLEIIQNACARIEKIVRGLKKFSRSSERSDHKVESIRELLSETFVFVAGKSKREATPITFDIQGEPKIMCDGVEIQQVIINLINNAIDAVKGSSERWIKVKSYEEQNQIVLQIIDSGHGIPPQVEAKLFQPFFTTKPVGEGTGLGLAIAKGILDQHQATIALDHSSKNTCFELRFQKPEPAVQIA